MIHDRFGWAASICKGMNVLDIGGSGAGWGTENNSYYKALYAFQGACKKRTCVDFKDGADLKVNLNNLDSIDKVVNASMAHDIVVAMEVLEHIPLGGYLLNRLCSETQVPIIVTLPANDNWILNTLGWDYDHVCRFTKATAIRFVHRCMSNTNRTATYYPLIGKYTPLWIPVYVASIFAPISHGFLISPPGGKP